VPIHNSLNFTENADSVLDLVERLLDVVVDQHCVKSFFTLFANVKGKEPTDICIYLLKKSKHEGWKCLEI